MIQLTAILSDYHGRVLLLPAPDGRTLALPTAELQPGQLPAETLAASIRTASGIIALPIRLTGLYAHDDGLTFAFRAIQRGGAIPPNETGLPVAAFFDAIPTPKPVSAATGQQMVDAMHHTGGAPICAAAPRSLGYRLRRLLGAPKPPTAADAWNVRANVILRDAAGSLLWQRQPGDQPLRLPGAVVARGALPGTVARDLARSLAETAAEPQLRGIYLHPHMRRLTLSYLSAAQFRLGDPALQSSTSDPPDANPGDVWQVHQALREQEEVDFAILPNVPGAPEAS